MIGESAALRRREDGYPDCVGGNLVGGAVGDFEIMLRRRRSRVGESGEVGLGEALGEGVGFA